MEKRPPGVFESQFDLELLLSTKPLQVVYSVDQQQAAISEAKMKWQQFQTKIDGFQQSLANFIVQKIQKERVEKSSEAIADYLKEQIAQAARDYNMLASLDSALRENEHLLEYSNAMKEISSLVKERYFSLSSNLLVIATGELQNRIWVDITTATSNWQKDASEGIFILESIESAFFEQNSNKRLSATELTALLSCFEEIVLTAYQKKIDGFLLNVREVAETACKELSEYVSSFIAKILIKLNELENDKSFDPAAKNIFRQSIDDFFSNIYSTELSFLESKLKDVFNEQVFQWTEQSITEKAISNNSSDDDCEVGKTNLADYFVQAKVALLKHKIPPTCLKAIKELKSSKKISVIEAGPNQQIFSQGKNPLVIKFNHIYLIALENSDSDRGGETAETIFYTQKEEIVKDYYAIELKMDFLPPKLEFPKEEIMILSFLVKLARFAYSKSEPDELPCLHQSQTIEIGIEVFLACSISYIAENHVKQLKREQKSFVLENENNLLLSTSNSDRSPHEQIRQLNGTVDSIVLANKSHFEESKSFALPGESLSLENIDGLEAVDMTETETDWKMSDTIIFLKLLENDKCKLLNDIRTLKLVSGLQDYIFIDKPTSAEIFVEYSESLKALTPSRSKDLRSKTLEKVLSSYDIEIIRGIVLLFSPLSAHFNLIALRIDFDTKNRNFFSLDSRNTDLSALKTLFKPFGKLVKRAVISRNVVKTKVAKFKDNYIFIKININESTRLQCFKEFYFPYTYVLRQKLNSSSTETISVEMLKDLLCNYLQAPYSSEDGIERMRNLLQVYHLYTNRFTNIFIIEELMDLDSIHGKIKQYLWLCFVDNIEEAAQKMKSILIFVRIRNEKLRSYDFILIFFEYAYPNQNEKEKLENPSEQSNPGRQNLYVFGDAYLHLVQVRGIIKAFFKEKELALSRVRLEFYQMKKTKTDTNVLLLDPSLFSCIFFILLNEKMPITDVICICRLCPAIQYRYLNAIFEKNRSNYYITRRIPRKFDLELKPVKVIGRQTIDLIDEIENTLSILELDQPNNQPGKLDWLIELKRGFGCKFVIVRMTPSGKNDGSFNVNLKEAKLPTEPFILITVNSAFGANNLNICNIIEPEGGVFILSAVAEVTTEQSKKNRKLEGIIKSIEQIQKSLPKVKANYKYIVTNHELHLKYLSGDNIQAFFDFIVMIYLLKYKTHKDLWFSVNENSILSLIFGELRICFRSAPESYSMVCSLQENHFLALGNSLIQRVHKNYTDDNLISLLGIFIASKNTRALVFSVQNDMEYTFHTVVKDAKTNIVQVMVASIKDQSLGNNVKNFYDKTLSSLQDGVLNVELKCEFMICELEALPIFFYSMNPNLLNLALANAVNIFGGQHYFQKIQKYLQTWYQPTILSSQFKEQLENYQYLLRQLSICVVLNDIVSSTLAY